MNKQARPTLLVAAGIVVGMLASSSWQTFSTAAQGNGCTNFPQTGHKVCGKFLAYWQGHGGLAQQGYPLSEEFVETSDLNGKPYTVQYFERAVFEYHPENQPPNDVLLSQLGTYAAARNYPKGFSNVSGEEPFYENRTDPRDALKSYYNAVNRKEYERAYSYFQGAPNPLPELAPPFAKFAAGYANTTSVTLAIGKGTMGAAAGNLYYSVPVVLTARNTNNTTTVFSGCYVMHRVNTGISQDPNDELWSINSAKLAPAAPGASLDTLLAQNCNP